MEIKCKVSFTLPKELVKALDITDETSLIAYVENGRVVVEIAEPDEGSKPCDGSEDGRECDGCEYYCPYCGNCVLD